MKKYINFEGRDKFIYEAIVFQSTDFAELVRVVNNFLGSLEKEKLIDVKYNAVPLAVSMNGI